jgi:hypothetical protein
MGGPSSSARGGRDGSTDVDRGDTDTWRAVEGEGRDRARVVRDWAGVRCQEGPCGVSEVEEAHGAGTKSEPDLLVRQQQTKHAQAKWLAPEREQCLKKC